MDGPRIHLYVRLVDTGDAESYAAATNLLSTAERERVGRLVSDPRKREFAIAHALLRMGLSRSFPHVDPTDWMFKPDRYGRPHVVGPVGGGSAHFSLSHTKGCVACAISPNPAIGVDVEEANPRSWLLELAQANFAPAETAVLRSLEPLERTERFFAYWTLKEAYIKARGEGLRIPLHRFWMTGVAEDELRIGFAEDVMDDASRWHFTRLAPSSHHSLAIADGSGTPGGLPILLEEFPATTADRRR
jgi:4'-phosphopantetheinyl transferase